MSHYPAIFFKHTCTFNSVEGQPQIPGGILESTPFPLKEKKGGKREKLGGKERDVLHF